MTHDKQMESAISEILEYFNWDKVHEVMTHLDWNWSDPQYGMIVPNIDKLKIRAVSLLFEACKCSRMHRAERSVATGGLRATAEYDKEEDKYYVSLVFELASWDNYS